MRQIIGVCIILLMVGMVMSASDPVSVQLSNMTGQCMKLEKGSRLCAERAIAEYESAMEERRNSLQ